MTDSSKFFTPNEFRPKSSPAIRKPSKIVKWDPDALQYAMEKIEEELVKIRNGTSKLVVRAIDPGGFGFPAHNAIKVFISDPNDKAFPGVKQIAKQDWGIKAATVFAEMLQAARFEVENISEEVVEVQASNFKEHVGGFFHDLLRSAGITMLPGTATERIREVGERFAAAIEHAAEAKAVESVRQLQDSTEEAFVNVETEIHRLKSVIVGLVDENKDLRDRAERLEGECGVLK